MPWCSPGTTKNAWKGDRHTNTQTHGQTLRLLDQIDPVGQFGENYATSWEKNHVTSQDKKIMQPLKTKKSRHLSGQKNHATSRTRKKNALFQDKKK